MRILHVIPSVAACRGGPSQAVLELVVASHQAGQRVEILTTNDDGSNLLNVPLGELTSFAGAPVRFFKRFSPPCRPLREFAISLPLARWLRAHVRDYSLIHIHALFSYPSSVAMRIARAEKVPYVNRPSGLLCRWSLQQSALKKRTFLRLFDRANLDGSAALEFTAEQERADAADLGLLSPNFVMPCGLQLPDVIVDARDQLRRRLNLNPDARIVLFMSRLHPKKGVHLLLNAAAGLREPQVHYVIAGSGEPDYEASLRELAGHPQLQGRVHFPGFASGELKQVLLQGADLFVLPSHSESFAIAVMEALAVGLPVITTPGVPLAYLLQKFDLGWVCQPEAEAVAASLTSALGALKDTTILSTRRNFARRLIRDNFTWPVIAARMHSVYEAINNGNRPLSFELRDVRVRSE